MFIINNVQISSSKHRFNLKQFKYIYVDCFEKENFKTCCKSIYEIDIFYQLLQNYAFILQGLTCLKCSGDNKTNAIMF